MTIKAVKYLDRSLNEIYLNEIDMLLASGEIKDGMYTKIQSCKEILNYSNKVWIGSSRAEDFKNAMNGKIVGTWLKRLKVNEDEFVSY